MSAPRPRPVTATIGKPPARGTFRPKKNVSLFSNSSGSTESLISCVNDSDHESGADSASELNSARDARRQRADVSITQKKSCNSNKNNNNSGTDDDSFTERIMSEKSEVTSVTPSEVTRTDSCKQTSSTKEPVTTIGPWEQWMIKKTESVDKLTEQKARLQKLRKQQEKQQEIERREKLQKADKVRQEWLQQKNEEKVRKERRQLLREKKKIRETEREKREIEEKAQKKYAEWLEQKKKTDALHHALEREQQKLKELELTEKKAQSDAAFQAWLVKASQRMKGIPHSYATCDGALTGYYDSAASPTPAYYNPVPWQPVALPVGHPKPKVKTKGRRRVPKNAWTLDN